MHTTQAKQPAQGRESTPMKARTIAIAGRARPALEAIRAQLQGHALLDVRVAPMDPGQTDPLQAHTRLPDVLILVVSSRCQDVLHALSTRYPGQRPATIVIGPDGDSSLMRLAMKAGVRDYIGPSVRTEELVDALLKIELAPGREEGMDAHGELIAVINSKGGSGASTIAANLAHIRACQRRKDVALVDMDVQFGTLPLAFDLSGCQSLLDILAAGSRMDAATLHSLASRHRSGVHVFSAMSEQMALPWELSGQALSDMLDIARRSYDAVIVDLPRQIDPLATVVLEKAEHIVIVVQQSLAHIRDAKRLLKVLTSTLAVPNEYVTIVVNRHVERNAISLRDIADAISPPRLAVLPNDYQSVSQALDVGSPLFELNRDLPITRALSDLLDMLVTKDTEQQQAGQEHKPRGLRAVLAHALRS